MQPWSRQSECVFCLFRRDLRRQVVGRQQGRNYHITPTPTGEESSRRSGTRQVPSRRSSQPRSDDKRNFGPFHSNGRSKDRSAAATDFHRPLQRMLEQDKEKRSKTIKALERVQRYYRENKMNKDSDMSQMRGLDPENILWPQFEKLVKDAVDGNPNASAWVDSHGEPKSIPAQSRRADIERELRFAFLDYVLDHKGKLSATYSRTPDVRYPSEWYPAARLLQRSIHLHVGPTNSGKTYNALKRLEQSQSGFYAGPLRLLAHEVYSRFNDRGIKCDLITGDDVRLDDSGEVSLYASTVEMVDSKREADVGVVDEIQMIGDAERGWAWTRALLAARVKELHLCGEARSVPLIRELVASMGDTLHIHQYERLNPLKVMSRSLRGNLKNLRKGDCVVSFSVVGIHALKQQIERDTGKRCAIVYGSLPPDTRAQQAALFNDPDNDYDYLVASDAIGMGLNLSIKRIIFETTKKWNGTFRETLTIPQIKQIAGRAGRYRTAQDDKTSTTQPRTSTGTTPKSIGLVTCLDEVDLAVLQHALSRDGPPLKAAGILPPGEVFVEFAKMLPEGTPFEYVLRRVCTTVDTNPRYKMCAITHQLKIARVIEDVEGLTTSDRLLICASPASYRVANVRVGDPETVTIALARIIASERPMTVADIPEIPLEVLDEPMTAAREYLASLESLHKSLILFIWLCYRFPRALNDKDMAFRAKELCEERINATLVRFSANPKLVRRLKEMQKSSEMLIQQAREKGITADMGLIMNPDRTVDEIDAAQKADTTEGTDETHLEPEIEVEGELDVGDGEEIQELGASSNEVNDTEYTNDTESSTQTAVSNHSIRSMESKFEAVQPETDVEEAQREQKSG